MKSALAKQLLAASMMGGMNAAMDLQTVRPDAKSRLIMPAAKYKARKKRMAIQKASRKANRS